ncbi:MAG: LysE family transporter [Candidatus Zixiibacteriota bacterium]|nr:MAG: LysE family transporter [candidate division Zixibacteria bacterium]
MELLGLFLNSFVIGFSGAVMPGPVLAVDIAETPRHGWKTGPVISLGHAISEIAVVIFLAVAVAVLTDNPVVTRVIASVGGVALLLMAGMMTYDTLRSRISYEAGSADLGSRAKLAGKGITTTLVNPYWYIWWATIGLALLVRAKEFGIAGPAVFYVGHILSDLVWYTAVSVTIWKGRKLLAGPRLKFLILICAAFLVYLGVKFMYDGLTGAVNWDLYNAAP